MLTYIYIYVALKRRRRQSTLRTTELGRGNSHEPCFPHLVSPPGKEVVFCLTFSVNFTTKLNTIIFDLSNLVL